MSLGNPTWMILTPPLTAFCARRRWPFPMGQASEDKPQHLYFESGQPATVGRFNPPKDLSYSSRMQAALKRDGDGAFGGTGGSGMEARRKEEFKQRRKMWKRRLDHLKALCIVVILSYGEPAAPKFLFVHL